MKTPNQSKHPRKIHIGKCPKCERPIRTVKYTRFRLDGINQGWDGVGYLCPYCLSVLSVGINPKVLAANVAVELESDFEQLRTALANLSEKVASLEMNLG